jgi:alpha-mannosidase
MALKLQQEINNTGVSVEYWRVLQVNLGEPDGITPSAHIEMGGYPSEDLRRNGKAPLCVAKFDVSGAEFTAVFKKEAVNLAPYDAARAAAYGFIKTQNVNDIDFTKAEDC